MSRVLTLFFTIFLLWSQVSLGKIYVVSVGIADYKEINDLNMSENDVKVFNELMEYQGAEITTLLGSKATHVNIISALRGTFAKATKDDTMIFFFSGHGYEGGFCCWDMSAAAPFSLNYGNKDNSDRLTQANRSFGGLSYEEMQILFRNCRAGGKIVFADACFSGGLQKGERLNLSVQSARNGDVVFFLSSQTNETSFEMSDAPNGVFTYFLIEGLLGDADTDEDGNINIKELYNYVYKNVTDYASAKNRSQHPMLWGKFDESLIVFELKN